MIFLTIYEINLIRCGLTWHKHTQETEKTSCFTSNGFHSTEITAHYSSLLLLRCKLETQKSLQTERKWRRVSAAVTCAMTQLCPTIWLRLEIHRSASIASSTTKMKESLESGAEGWKTHVNTHPWMNASTHVRESGWQKKREEMLPRRACVFVCVLAHYCLLGQSGLIRFWKQITSANHSIKPTHGLGHYLEYSTTSFSRLGMKRNCGQQGNSMKL